MGTEPAPRDGPYTVADALDEYFINYAKRGKAVSAARSAANLHIRPALGPVPIAKLTTKRLRDWHHGIADKPRQTRGKRGGPSKDAKRRTTGRDATRKRRATANRVLTVLKAALNYVWREGIAPSDDAWRRVSPFKAVDAPVIRYLSDNEVRRLVNACPMDFRDLVRGALLTGCRYGELIALRVADYNAEAGTVTVRVSKTGKVRHVVLADEGRNLFNSLVAGRPIDARIFHRSDGKPWGVSHQQRPLAGACARARISPAVSFNILRHSHGSALAMRGVPMGVIAAQLGHSLGFVCAENLPAAQLQRHSLAPLCAYRLRDAHLRETDCVAGHVGLELRNVDANYRFERSHRLPVSSRILALETIRV
jgi:integrase